LPALIQRVKQTHPGIRLSLRSGFQNEIESWLVAKQIDLAIVPRRGRLPSQIRALPLLRLPLVLQVPKKSRVKSAAELWARGVGGEPLVSIPETEAISILFQRGLKKRGIAWAISVEASSIEAITGYVADGHGIGVNVCVPAVVRHPRVRVLPLEDFEPLELVALWHGQPSPLIRALVREIQDYVRVTWPAAAVESELGKTLIA
jgi:DNA-binding transcriptional LysR family regulator